MKILLMLSILTVPACSQPQGTVNGIVIPNKAFDYAGPRTQVEVAFRLKNKRAIEKEDLPILERSVQAQRCSKLRGTIASMVQDQVMKDMALTVTPADIAEAQREVPAQILKKRFARSMNTRRRFWPLSMRNSTNTRTRSRCMTSI